jgi:transposase
MEVGILRRQGLSLREIARETGMAVNTVRKYLAQDGPPRYGPRGPQSSKLDAFKPYLVARVEAARPDWIPATVLWREIKEQGFQGCDRLVSRFLRTLKPKPAVEPLVRFETEAGQQLQADWCQRRRNFPQKRRSKFPQFGFTGISRIGSGSLLGPTPAPAFGGWIGRWTGGDARAHVLGQQLRMFAQAVARSLNANHHCVVQ